MRRGSVTEQQDSLEERCRRSVVIACLNEKRPGVRSINGRMAFPPILRACDTELLSRSLQGQVSRAVTPGLFRFDAPVGNALRGVPVQSGTPRRAFPTGMKHRSVAETE